MAAAIVIQLFPAPAPEPSARVFKFPAKRIFRPLSKRLQPVQSMDDEDTLLGRELNALLRIVNADRMRRKLPLATLQEVEDMTHQAIQSV